MREELYYLSADPERVREPMTIERLANAPLILYDARWGADDPMRRQLARARAASGGDARAADRGRIRRGGARALRAAAWGTRSARWRWSGSRSLARKLTGVGFDPPLHDTFAFITRRSAHLSPAARAFIALAEQRLAALQRQLG